MADKQEGKGTPESKGKKNPGGISDRAIERIETEPDFREVIDHLSHSPKEEVKVIDSILICLNTAPASDRATIRNAIAVTVQAFDGLANKLETIGEGGEQPQ